ncbi:MAG: ribonuclease D [Balneolaceae bacterium]
MTIHYIAENDELIKLAASLSKLSEFAIDLEFDRNRYRYGFNICLMQIFDGADCYLVDPLSGNLDIKTIFPPIENPDITKVVFAFGEDLRLLHSMGCFPKNLYDLDAATSLLNFEPASLTNLIMDVLDVEVNSSSQQSNWYKRPLTENQKLYAADDVLYLLDFKKELESRAKEKGLLDWIKQENALFDQLDYSDEDHNNLLKEKDKNNMSFFEWHVYSALMEFFDGVAKKYNKPVYQLVNKKLVSQLAQNPDSVDKWNNTKGVFGKLKNDSFKTELKQVLNQSIEEAQKRELSKSRKASNTMSRQEYQEMRAEQHHINNMKQKLFDPLQNKIAEDFGKHAKSFILPNRLAKEIIGGETELIPDYKVELFRKYADELNLDLSKYI